MEQLVCQKRKCPDCLTGEGDPAWCYRAGQPSQVAVDKCPKVLGKQNVPEVNGKKTRREK